MTLSEAIHHLQNLRRELGDVELVIDCDVWKDTFTRPATSFAAIDLLITPAAFCIGDFTHERVTKVVMFIGNEPKVLVGG